MGGIESCQVDVEFGQGAATSFRKADHVTKGLAQDGHLSQYLGSMNTMIYDSLSDQMHTEFVILI